MTKDEWNNCCDAPDMIEFVWRQEPFRTVSERFKEYPATNDWKDYLDIEMPLYKFYIACCREIWLLLPQNESKRGVELAEQYIRGETEWEELSRYNWYVEGAAFTFDYETDTEKVSLWVEETESSHMELIEKLGSSNTLDLLKDAAYFVDYAMIYPSIQPKGSPSACYHKFLQPKLLRKLVKYPV
ncbi:hypothetical protein ACJJJB_03280 [Microbulbifer sp. ANSA001]|uniref:hypothetical protein n=1 Tax=Microbulbifer sp. ANSA001 TaxID=3243358 RepID=UPI004042FE06